MGSLARAPPFKSVIKGGTPAGSIRKLQTNLVAFSSGVAISHGSPSAYAQLVVVKRDRRPNGQLLENRHARARNRNIEELRMQHRFPPFVVRGKDGQRNAQRIASLPPALSLSFYPRHLPSIG